MRSWSWMFLVFGAWSAQATTIAVAIGPGVGLDDAEKATLADDIATALKAQNATATPARSLADNCTGDAACVRAAVEAHHADALLVVEVMRVGDDADVTEDLLARDGRLLAHATASVAVGTLKSAPLLPDVKAAVGELAPALATPTAVAAPPPPKGDGRLGIGLAVAADVALLHARTLGVTIREANLSNALAGEGVKGAGGGALVQLSWMVPVPGSPWNRAFGFEGGVGYNVTATNGTIPFTQYETKNGVTELVTTNYDYSSLIHVIPLTFGLRSRLPLDLPLHLDVGAGGSSLWGLSIAQASIAKSSVAFATDNTASDIAWGFYVDGGAAWTMGPGEFFAHYRYLSAYLDFEHPAENPGPGDLGGHHVVVGYRFTL